MKDLSKLPKWARELIENKDRQIRDANSRIEHLENSISGETESPLSWSDYVRTIPLDSSGHACFRIPDETGYLVNVRFQIRESQPGTILVQADTPVCFSPEASNMFRIRVESRR